MLTAELVSVGREVLRGFTINTNASWLAQELISLGINVRRVTVVDDSFEDIEDVTKGILIRHPDVVVYTGGLGPTFDDITVEAVSRSIGVALELNEEALEMVRKIYDKIGLPLTEERIKMAKMPRGSIPLPNPIGTAPGVWFEYEGIIFVMLPGVPREMKAIFNEYVKPRLYQLPDRGYYEERKFTVRGIPESEAARLVKKVISMFPDIYIKSHPMGIEHEKPVIIFQLSYLGDERRGVSEKLDMAMSALIDEVKKWGAQVE